MSDHVVRGYWLTGGVKFLRTYYPAETNERILGALSRTLRSMLADIQPVQWYPRAHHVDMLKAVVSAHRDENSAFEGLLAYGQLVATDAASGSIRPLIQILTPLLLARKLPDLWASDHQDDGRLESDLAQIDDAKLSLRLSAVHGYEHGGVVALGWVKGLLMALGRRDIQVKQSGWSLSQVAPSEITAEVRWS